MTPLLTFITILPCINLSTELNIDIQYVTTTHNLLRLPCVGRYMYMYDHTYIFKVFATCTSSFKSISESIIHVFHAHALFVVPEIA